MLTIIPFFTEQLFPMHRLVHSFENLYTKKNWNRHKSLFRIWSDLSSDLLTQKVYLQQLEDFSIHSQKNPSSFLNLWTFWDFQTTFNFFLAILKPSIWKYQFLKTTSYISWFKGFTRGNTERYLAKMCQCERSILDSRRRLYGGTTYFRTVFSFIRWKHIFCRQDSLHGLVEGDGISINLMSILRMIIKRVEVPWTTIRFETKSHSCYPLVRYLNYYLMLTPQRR